MIFFGPGDFSILGGFAGQWDHPRIADAIKRISAAVQKTGKQWGMPIFSVEWGEMSSNSADGFADGRDLNVFFAPDSTSYSSALCCWA